MRNNKGITLVALVVTIIVLLILAGVTIAMVTGENGLLGNATESKQATIEAEVNEMVKLAAIDVKTSVLKENMTSTNASYKPTDDADVWHDKLVKNLGTKNVAGTDNYYVTEAEEINQDDNINGTNLDAVIYEISYSSSEYRSAVKDTTAMIFFYVVVDDATYDVYLSKAFYCSEEAGKYSAVLGNGTPSILYSSLPLGNSIRTTGMVDYSGGAAGDDWPTGTRIEKNTAFGWGQSN